MEKRHQLKRNHHYVWAHYLKYWSLDDLNVCYTTKKQNYRCESVTGLAKETDFYKINFLNEDDVIFIRSLSSASPEELRKIHDEYLIDFYNASKVAELSEAVELPLGITRELEAFQHNVLENIHTSIESSARETLSRLTKGDLSILEIAENRVNFFKFFAMQMTRTKPNKNNVFSRINSRKNNQEEISQENIEKYRQLMEKNWWFLSYMFGINLGSYLIANRNIDKHVLLINNTPEPFITSDNPIINVHKSLELMSEGTVPEFVDAYYPLSPNYAYMINNSERYQSGKVVINEKEAIEFNIQMAKNSKEHIFAQSEVQLRKIKKLCKK